MEDFKKAAAGAALDLIKRDMVIGFGAGSTIAHLIGFIREVPDLAAGIQAVTSSYSTKILLQRFGFTIREMEGLDRIDLYFDGCDQFDRQLNALKSGGGIHTREKILAAMAGEFILIGDESKSVESINGQYPLVVEVIPDALGYVLGRLSGLFEGVQSTVRMAAKKDGAVITEHGNFLIDCRFTHFPEAARVNDLVIQVPGVLEHSLFYGLARMAIVAGPGGIKVRVPR